MIAKLSKLTDEDTPSLRARATGVHASRGVAKGVPLDIPSDFQVDFERLWRVAEISPVENLLTEGGDERIICGPNGQNRYGSTSLPDAEVLAFGSSTASTISESSFTAAKALRARVVEASVHEPAHIIYERELNRVRRDLIQLCGLKELSGLEVIFGASGTDLHLFASQFVIDPQARAPLIIRVEAAETGRGVPDALAGCHFSNRAALGDAVVAKAPIDCGRAIEILEVKARTVDGQVRSPSLIDAEVEFAVSKAVAEGRRVLLTLVDVSKTGLLAPSAACVDTLRGRFPKAVEVLIDACQFRLSSPTLIAYLQHGCMVALTGSKFFTGPTFCGALLVPEKVASRLKTRPLPTALKSYTTRADWPRDWAAREVLPARANFGLLLRWEAALTELRAFRKLSELAIDEFLKAFGAAVVKHIVANPAFEFVAVPVINRTPISNSPSWDNLPTIFSFLLCRTSARDRRVWLSPDETKKVHDVLRQDMGGLSSSAPRRLLSLRCQLGQPVTCGKRDGSPVTALRLCASSRVIVDALSPTGRGAQAVISDALAALDKAALLSSMQLN